MKNLIISQLLTLFVILFSINFNYAQTTFGLNAGTGGGLTGSFFGAYSGQNNTLTHNSFFGYQSGKNNDTGSHNSFFGSLSGEYNIDGTRNSFFGVHSGRANISGNDNTFAGSHSGYKNETGEENTFFGSSSGHYNVDGSYNSFIGKQAGIYNISGNENSFFGYKSGYFNDLGEKNTFLGANSGFGNKIGIGNTFIGYKAGRNATGNSNIFIGYEAGYYETGDNKLYIANSSTDEPLIYGDFAISELNFNAKIGITSSTGTSEIENVQHAHNGVPENFLSLRANKNSGNSILISETGRITVGSDGACMRHTTDNDTTFLIVDGAALKYGDPFWQSASDQNLKKNITPLQKSLNKFLNLNFYSYQYKKTDQTRYGIVAQEMEELFPHSMGKLIEEDGTEYLTFNPNNLFYTGFKATQEIGEITLAQEAKIESLKQENEQLAMATKDLQIENDHLKSELEAIKTALKNNGIDITQNNTNDNSLKDEVPHLLQNNPNPLNETTSIPYVLTNNTKNAVIIVNDLSGKTIEKYTLPEGVKNGSLEINLKPFDLSKGIYNYSLVIDGVLVATKQMLLN